MLYTRNIQGNLPLRMRNKLGNKEEIYERLQQRQEFKERTTISTLVICYQCIQDRTSEYRLFQSVEPAVLLGKNQEPRPYVVETQNGWVLRRNRRHIHDENNLRRKQFDVNATVQTPPTVCGCPETPTVCGSAETPTVCGSRKVRFENENRKTQPTVHNYRQKLSESEEKTNVPLHVTRSLAVMDHDGQYKTRTGRVIRKPRCYDQLYE